MFQTTRVTVSIEIPDGLWDDGQLQSFAEAIVRSDPAQTLRDMMLRHLPKEMQEEVALGDRIEFKLERS